MSNKRTKTTFGRQLGPVHGPAAYATLAFQRRTRNWHSVIALLLQQDLDYRKEREKKNDQLCFLKDNHDGRLAFAYLRARQVVGEGKHACKCDTEGKVDREGRFEKEG